MKRAVLGLLVGLVSGCAVPLKVAAPTSPLIDTPETRGTKGKFQAGVQIAQQPEVVLSRDIKVVDPDLDRPELEDESLWVHLSGGYSVTEWFDIEARLFPAIKGKVQLVKGDVPVAVTLGGSYYPGKVSKDDSTSTTVNTTSYSYNSWGIEGSAQAGYRINPAFLLYGGILFSYSSFSGTYRVDSRGINGAPFGGTYFQWGPSVGLEWKFRFLNSRWGFSVLNVESQGSKNTFAAFGTEAVFRFGWKDEVAPAAVPKPE